MLRSSVASKLSSAASKAESWFEARVVPAMRRFGEFAFIAAVRDALPYGFAVLLLALLAILPMTHTPGAFFSRSFGIRLSTALLPSFGIMAPALAVALAIVYARKAQVAMLPMVGAVVIGFTLAVPRPFAPSLLAYLRALGPSGLFLAMLVCGAVAASIALVRSTNAPRPAGDWIGAGAALALLGTLLLGHVSVTAGIAAAMVPLAHLGDSYTALIIIVLVETLLWTAGIHGPATLAAVVTPLYLTLQTQNTAAFIHHRPLPHIVVVSLFLFVFPGGAGGTLPLAFLLACSRVKRLHQTGRVALIPSIFNINEPLIFGAPIVFNPYLAIPFVLAPLVLASLTYAVVAIGWVARPAIYMPSSIPSLLSTYWATYDPRAMLLLLINVAVAAAIYWPFVRSYERHLETA